MSGQDGAYLAEFLLDKGQEVYGLKRRFSSSNTSRIDHLHQDPHEADVRFHLHFEDLTDTTNLIRIIAETRPTGICNLAAYGVAKPYDCETIVKYQENPGDGQDECSAPPGSCFNSDMIR